MFLIPILQKSLFFLFFFAVTCGLFGALRPCNEGAMRAHIQARGGGWEGQRWLLFLR